MRILAAMTQLACERGIESLTVSEVVARAGVSRATFYLVFENLGHCIEAALETALALAIERVAPAYRSRATWVDGVRASLLALLELFDEEPELARLYVLQAVSAPSAAMSRRSEVLRGLAAVLDEARATACVDSPLPPPLTAEVLVGGALAVIHARLLRHETRELVELLNPLMATIVLPYLGAAAAERELDGHVPRRPPVPLKPRAVKNPLQGLNLRLTYRTMQVMMVVAAESGLSNLEVGRRAGMTDHSQISKLLARLARLGLLENTAAGRPKGAPNAWQLTRRGRQVERALAADADGAARWWRASR